MNTSALSGNKKYVHELNAIKGICALLIAFLYHPLTVGFTDGGRLPFDGIGFISFFQQNGRILVEVFFMISGYISWNVYSSKIGRDGASVYASFGRFIKRRIIRIFPLMWVTLIMTVIAQVIHLKMTGGYFVVPNNSSSEIIYNLLGLQLFCTGPSWNAPAWALNKMLICWCIFFFIAYRSRDDKAKAVFFNTVLMILGLVLVVQENTESIPFFDLASGRAYLSFFLGCNLCIMRESLTKKQLGIICCFLAGLNAVFILLRFICGVESFNYEPYFISFPLIVYPLILIGVQLVKPVSFLLGLKPFQFLGKISYAVYLCNFPMQIIIYLVITQNGINISFASPLFFAVNAAVQLIVATLVWWLVECKLTDYIKTKI